MRTLSIALTVLLTACGSSHTGSDCGCAFDGGSADAGVLCGESGFGSCPSSLSCQCCGSGPITIHCLCTTLCASATDCSDSARPECRDPVVDSQHFCAPSTFLCSSTRCASPDTPIATPDGERPIAELREGDLVYSVDRDAVVIVPIARTSRMAASGHRVMHIALSNRRVLEISAGHPTADGRLFAELAAGGSLDGVAIVEASEIAYQHPLTYDILPASDSGTYYAAGVRIGSTLAH